MESAILQENPEPPSSSKPLPVDKINFRCTDLLNFPCFRVLKDHALVCEFQPARSLLSQKDGQVRIIQCAHHVVHYNLPYIL